VALILPTETLDAVHTHARAGYPHEVVGILAGRRADTTPSQRDSVVTRVVSLVNERSDSPANRYAVGALALHRAEVALEAEGLEVVGYYHSHPDHPARYSDFDRDHALPNMSYVIASVIAGAIADTRSWRLRDDRAAMDEELILPEESTVAISISIPAALRAYTDGKANVVVEAATAGQALDALTTGYPGLAKHLRDADGKLRSFVNVYLNDEDIRHLQKDATALSPGDTLIIVPSIAGGR